MERARRRTGFALAGVLLGLAGCQLPLAEQGGLPEGYRLVRGQLEIHSSFPLASRHRLVEELVRLREDIRQTLGIPRSDEPIHVYLFESPDRYENFRSAAFPGFPNRRAFFVETDTRLAVFASWGDRVAEDLCHEVAHGYLHAVLPGLPLWLDEGLAEYFEVPRAWNGLNRPHVRLLLRDHARGTWQPDLVRLERFTTPAQMDQRDYAESWAWVHWMLESSPAHRKRLRRYLARLRITGKVPPLSEILDRDVPDADQELIAWLKQIRPSPPPPVSPESRLRRKEKNPRH